MDAKTFLNKARTINMEIDSKLKQTQGFRHLVTNVTATLSEIGRAHV